MTLDREKLQLRGGYNDYYISTCSHLLNAVRRNASLHISLTTTHSYVADHIIVNQTYFVHLRSPQSAPAPIADAYTYCGAGTAVPYAHSNTSRRT